VRFRRIAPVVVLAVAASLTTFPSGPAHAATVTGLPITEVDQVLAASAQGHIFIGQGPDALPDAPIVVTNLSGTPVASIGDGAEGMALSANDATLYAATGNVVTAFNTTTLKQIGTYPLPSTAAVAWSVAVQDGRLWVGYRTAGFGAIGAIDLATGSASWNAVPGDWVGAPEIAADPSDTGVLVTSSVGQNPATLAAYDVADPSAVSLTASTTGSPDCDVPGTLTVLPGGATVLCDGTPYSTATMVQSGTSYENITAVAPNGALADLDEYASLLAYRPGATAPTASYDQPWYGLPLPSSFDVESSSPVDFAWAADSEQLFTVMRSTNIDGDSIYTLLSLYPFERVPADLTLASTATTIGYGGSFTVTAHLGVTYTNPNYSFYQTIAGHPRQLVQSCPCGLPGVVGTTASSWTTNTTYTAVYTGDALYEPKTVTLAIKVGAKIADSLSGYYKTTTVAGLQYRLYHRNATLKDLVTVTPKKTGECVRFEVQKSVGNVWHADTLSGCATLNKWSQTMLTSKLGSTGWYRFRPDFTASAKDTTNVSTDGGWLYYVVPV
jgi:hypothetical protein